MMVIFACAVGGGPCKLVQMACGLEEQEFYRQRPADWWIVVAMGSGFIIGLAYVVRKNLDIDPNVQLRSQPDEVLKGVLADPDCRPWYHEALRLLNKRWNAQQNSRRSK